MKINSEASIIYPQAGCQSRDFVKSSFLESTSVNASHLSSPACDLCSSEYRAHQSITSASQCHVSPACADPECLETICETCTEHYDCCGDYLEDCGLDCGACDECDDSGPGCQDDTFYAGSYSELFGDQATEMFGFGCCLPPLSKTTTSAESSTAELSSGENDLPAETTLLLRNDSSRNANIHESASDSMPSLGQEGSPRSGREIRTAMQRNPSTALISPEDSCCEGHLGKHIPHASPLFASASSGQFTDHTINNAVHSIDNVSVRGLNTCPEFTSCTKSIPPTVQCQWADHNGQVCGAEFTLGNSLHEHLQTVHIVKDEVFCHWKGCSVSIFGASPHQYVNSVQRHTWGHSGYRPYKCSVCGEGFAAAQILEDHFTNFHLRRKVFACNMCSHQCTSAANLKRHKGEKHRAERFQCEFCNMNGRLKLFPRGPNLARHFRKCKYVLAAFAEAKGAAEGKLDDDWFPPNYRKGNHGMDRAKILPPNYMPVQDDF